MPRGDGAGPMGLGPMTGRAVGYCSGNSVPGYLNQPFRNVYCRRGGGRGFHQGFWATGVPGPEWVRFSGLVEQSDGLNPALEARWLTNQIKMMEQSLQNAKERLNELQKSEEN